jgi:F-type H+-transporting ATPase subunit alpha
MPAIDIGKSVSRVGGKAQLSAYRAVAGKLRLAYAQFEELETFARFGTRLDDQTRKDLERGRRVRAILRQPQYAPVAVTGQIAAMLAVSEGLFDSIPADQVSRAEEIVRNAVASGNPDISERIETGQPLEDRDRGSLMTTATHALQNEGLFEQGEDHQKAQEKG